jgi:hypothetical protein
MQHALPVREPRACFALDPTQIERRRLLWLTEAGQLGAKRVALGLSSL